MPRAVSTLIAFGLIAASVAPAAAHERNFARTYDWFTPSRGEKELELWWIQERGGAADAQVELEYGLTERWAIAPYLLMKREHGGDFEVEGWKLEQRYRFGSLRSHKLLPAVYFEVKKENGEPYELEGKLIGSYLFGSGWIWSGNLVFEGELKNGEPTKIGYATGVGRPVTPRLSAGLELFGNWTEKEHFLGPALGYRFAPGAKLLVNGGFRVGGPKGGAVTLLFEKEWR